MPLTSTPNFKQINPAVPELYPKYAILHGIGLVNGAVLGVFGPHGPSTNSNPGLAQGTYLQNFGPLAYFLRALSCSQTDRQTDGRHVPPRKATDFVNGPTNDQKFSSHGHLIMRRFRNWLVVVLRSRRTAQRRWRVSMKYLRRSRWCWQRRRCSWSIILRLSLTKVTFRWRHVPLLLCRRTSPTARPWLAGVLIAIGAHNLVAFHKSAIELP